MKTEAIIDYERKQIRQQKTKQNRKIEKQLQNVNRWKKQRNSTEAKVLSERLRETSYFNFTSEPKYSFPVSMPARAGTGRIILFDLKTTLIRWCTGRGFAVLNLILFSSVIIPGCWLSGQGRFARVSLDQSRKSGGESGQMGVGQGKQGGTGDGNGGWKRFKHISSMTSYSLKTNPATRKFSLRHILTSNGRRWNKWRHCLTTSALRVSPRQICKWTNHVAGNLWRVHGGVIDRYWRQRERPGPDLQVREVCILH